MATVCVGCGLELNNEGRLTVATPGAWPLADINGDNFRCNDLGGAATYCDSQGNIRGVPEHTTASDTVITDVNAVPAPGGQAAIMDVVFTNPSDCRRMEIMGVVDGGFTEITTKAGGRVVITLVRSENGATPIDYIQLLSPNSPTADITAPGSFRGISFRVLLAPGETKVDQWSVEWHEQQAGSSPPELIPGVFGIRWIGSTV